MALISTKLFPIPLKRLTNSITTHSYKKFKSHFLKFLVILHWHFGRKLPQCSSLKASKGSLCWIKVSKWYGTILSYLKPLNWYKSLIDIEIFERKRIPSSIFFDQKLKVSTANEFWFTIFLKKFCNKGIWKIRFWNFFACSRFSKIVSWSD